MSPLELIWIALTIALLSNGIYNTTDHSGPAYQQQYNYSHPGMGYNYSFDMGHHR